MNDLKKEILKKRAKQSEEYTGFFERKEVSAEQSGEYHTVWDNVKVEINEVFGAFPRKDDLDAKYIMTATELCRVHSKYYDYRNAYKVITQCAKMYPKNPFVLSRVGRFCLETGRLNEALNYFKMNSDLLLE